MQLGSEAQNAGSGVGTGVGTAVGTAVADSENLCGSPRSIDFVKFLRQGWVLAEGGHVLWGHFADVETRGGTSTCCRRACSRAALGLGLVLVVQVTQNSLEEGEAEVGLVCMAQNRQWGEVKGGS